MNDYFKPIDLPETYTPKKVTEDPAWPTKELWDVINDKIAKELDLIATGYSKFTPNGIQLKPNGPLMSAFRRFKGNPTPEHLEEFISVTLQDVGNSAAKAFRLWCNLAIEEVKNDTKE